MRKRIFDVREGDHWVFQTNTGGIERRITGVEDPSIKRARIYYRGYGDSHETSCLRSTFRRWWRGAGLSFATDWTNRNSDGDTVIAAAPERDGGEL